MQALLNTVAGTGLVINGDATFFLQLDGEPESNSAQVNALPRVLGDRRNIEVVEVNALEDAIEALRGGHLREESLDLALILLDADLSDEIRHEAARELDQILGDSRVESWLHGVLYGAPLPAAADVDHAIHIADASGARAVWSMLSRLSSSQTLIQRVHDTWNLVCGRVLASPESRQEAIVLAARGGILWRLVHALEGTGPNEFRFVALQVLQHIPNHRRIVEELSEELRLVRRSPRMSWPLVEEEASDQSRSERRNRESISFDRGAVFEAVNRQKEAIVGHMNRGRYDLVAQYVEELIAYQLPFDHRGEYTSKSLCDLSMAAKTLELFELQFELAKRAVEVRYEDGWAWSQVGDAALILGQFDQASDAFRNAIAFGEDRVGRLGVARLLLKMGEHQRSLLVYEEVIREHPTDIFAKSGRAEVLKAMGQLEEALAAYEEVIREHPADVVTKNGRAEVLKSMGRLDEAVAAYEEVIREHPTSVFAKNGRAEVLKSKGRLDEALAAYEEVIREYPTDVVAKSGRAEVLKSMGRHEGALAAYEEVIREHPTSVVAKNGRAEVLKSIGQLDEALAAYEEGIRDHPTDVVTKNGRAEVLKSMGRLDEALAAYEEVIREHPTDVVAKNGRAEVLRSMGRLDEALAAYEEVIRKYRTEVFAKNGRAEVLKSTGQLDKAQAAYEEVIREHPTDVVAKNGRAEVLKSKGQLDEALAAYDDVIREHPMDPYAKNGRAAVLCAAGRYEETLALTLMPARTRQEWISLHIRGMAMIRARRIDKALEIFALGAEANPFIGDRDAFRSGLALARLHQRSYEAALESLENVHEFHSWRVASFLRSHSIGALGDIASAARFLSAVGPPRNNRERELKAELERRFVRKEAPMHDHDWLIDREIDCMLLAA